MANLRSASVLVLAAACVCLVSIGQGRPDPSKLIPAQQAALSKLSFMDGLWRGTASTLSPSGEQHTIVQTEQVGPFLDGSVKVIEGRGYDADGKVTFNAFGTISFDPGAGAYTLHSYAMGNVGDFTLTATPTGFSWEIPAGPTTIRYTATIKDGNWQEVGDRIVPGKDSIRISR